MRSRQWPCSATLQSSPDSVQDSNRKGWQRSATRMAWPRMLASLQAQNNSALLGRSRSRPRASLACQDRDWQAGLRCQDDMQETSARFSTCLLCQSSCRAAVVCCRVPEVSWQCNARHVRLAAELNPALRQPCSLQNIPRWRVRSYCTQVAVPPGLRPHVDVAAPLASHAASTVSFGAHASSGREGQIWCGIFAWPGTTS